MLAAHRHKGRMALNTAQVASVVRQGPLVTASGSGVCPSGTFQRHLARLRRLLQAMLRSTLTAVEQRFLQRASLTGHWNCRNSSTTSRCIRVRWWPQAWAMVIQCVQAIRQRTVPEAPRQVLARLTRARAVLTPRTMW